MIKINIHYTRDIFYGIKKDFSHENLELKQIFTDIDTSINNSNNKSDKQEDKGSSWRVSRKPIRTPPKNKEEEIKNSINSFLNKLSPKNYNNISEQIRDLLKTNIDLLEYTVDNIFQKAVYQPTYCKNYVNLLTLFNESDLDINYLINQKCNIYNSMLEEEVIDLSNQDINYDEFCENIKNKSYKVGFSQFIGELFNRDMISDIFIKRNISQQINKTKDILKEENMNETNLENNIICVCTLINIVKDILNKEELLEDVCELQINKKIIPRLRFKLLDLADSLKK